MKNRLRMALDKSQRRIDENGYLHVGVNNISKATVNPYNGDEIQDMAPGVVIDPKQVYFLLRDPEELARAARTFNNLPLLDFHEPISAEEFDEKREFVVGSTGDQAQFVSPFLQNSLVVWDAGAIGRIDSRQQVELSCAYRYEIDMTPGTFEGVAYDGVMRNLRGNHVALVDEGRAGPDVVVSDAKPKEKPQMKKKLTPRAIAVRGALLGRLPLLLASDQKLQIADLTPLVSPLTVKGYKTQKVKLLQDLKTTFKGKLAQDADLDDIMDLLDSLEGDEGEELELDAAKPPVPVAKPTPIAKDDDMGEDGDEAGQALLALLQAQNLPDELMSQVAQLLEQLTAPKGVDALPPKKGTEVPNPNDPKPVIGKPAMDAAILAASNATVARMTAIRQAEDEVEPILGRIRGTDSAEAVYRLALDHRKVDVAGVHPSAYRALVQMLLGQQEAEPEPALGMDRAAEDSYEKRYGASRIGRA